MQKVDAPNPCVTQGLRFYVKIYVWIIMIKKDSLESFNICLVTWHRVTIWADKLVFQSPAHLKWNLNGVTFLKKYNYLT